MQAVALGDEFSVCQESPDANSSRVGEPPAKASDMPQPVRSANISPSSTPPRVTPSTAISTIQSKPSVSTFSSNDPKTLQSLSTQLLDVIVSNPNVPSQIGKKLLSEAVQSSIENTIKLVLPSLATASERQAAYADLRDMFVTALTKKNAGAIVGKFGGNFVTGIVAQTIGDALSAWAVKQLSKSSPVLAANQQLLRDGIGLAVTTAVAARSGVAGVIVADSIYLAAIERKGIQELATAVKDVKQEAATIDRYRENMRGSLAAALKMPDSPAKKSALSAGIRALNEVDQIIMNDPILRLYYKM